MILITADLLRRAMGCAPSVASDWWVPLREACAACDITTAPRIAAFLAQIGHESENLSRRSENLRYSAQRLEAVWPARYTPALAAQHAYKPEAIANHVYGGRLGNAQPGDGWRFRGRGPIQVTGRENYAAVTALVRRYRKDAPDFECSPDLLEQPEWGAWTAATWWHSKGLNDLADLADFDRITRRINGGTHGLADRRDRLARAKRALA